jgi:hypothetical protein
VKRGGSRGGPLSAPWSAKIFGLRSLGRGIALQERELEIHHLPDVEVEMGGATEKDVEPVFGSFFAGGTISLAPVILGLGARSASDHGHGVDKTSHHLTFLWRGRFSKFAVAIADVSAIRNLCPDVVIEISGEMQHEMSETVAERERLAPELFFGQRGGEFADFAA